MRDIRSNRSSSSGTQSYDSGFESLTPRRRPRISPEEREMRAAFSAANEENWQNHYQRHNASGSARSLTSKVSHF